LPFARGLPTVVAPESFRRVRVRGVAGRSEVEYGKRERPDGVLIMKVSTHDTPPGVPVGNLF
jgi:hypothetical protein